MQMIITILVCAIAAAMVGKWVFVFFRSMVKPGKGGCGGSCGCGREKSSSQKVKMGFVPVSAVRKK